MERDDRNALRYERELRKKYLKQFAKKTTTNSLSPGFEKFKRESVSAGHALLGFRGDRRVGNSMASAKGDKKLSLASTF